jgi:hypothetical protein
MMILKTGSGVFHHCETPPGRPATIDAKIISEMPLPMPRWVISSPIHMTRIEPAVRQSTTRMTVPALKDSNTGWPPAEPCERKRNV